MVVSVRMIILAAGQGTRLRPLTELRPKCLVELGGRPLLHWQLDVAKNVGIEDVVIVAGYLADKLDPRDARIVLNDRFASTNMVESLFCAAHLFEEGFICSYGDIVYSRSILETLIRDDAPIGVVVDLEWRQYWARRFDDPLSDAESLRLDADGYIQSIGQAETDIERIAGQYIGLMAFRKEGVAALRKAYALAREAAQSGRNPFGGARSLDKLYMTDLLQGMINVGHRIKAVPVHGGWLEIDSQQDLLLGEELVSSGRLGDARDHRDAG